MVNEEIKSLQNDGKGNKQEADFLKHTLLIFKGHYHAPTQQPMIATQPDRQRMAPQTPPRQAFPQQRPLQQRSSQQSPAHSLPAQANTRLEYAEHADLEHLLRDNGRYPAHQPPRGDRPIVAQMMQPPQQRVARDQSVMNPNFPSQGVQVGQTVSSFTQHDRHPRPSNPQPYFAPQPATADAPQRPRQPWQQAPVVDQPHQTIQAPIPHRAAVQGPPLPPRPSPAMPVSVPARFASNNPYQSMMVRTAPVSVPHQAEAQFARWIHDSSGGQRDIVDMAIAMFRSQPGLTDEASRYHQRQSRQLPPDPRADAYYHSQIQRIATEVLNLNAQERMR